MLKRTKNKQAFSLLELMFSFAVLLIILIGLMYTYITCFKLNNSSRNLTLVNNALQAEMESILEAPFDSLPALDGTTFTLSGFSAANAVGIVDVYDSIYSNLKYIRLVGCWRDGNNRVIGEDVNLDGVLTSSEDLVDLGTLNSPAELVTLIIKDESKVE
jgi:hypothetical protein